MTTAFDTNPPDRPATSFLLAAASAAFLLCATASGLFSVALSGIQL